MTEYNNNNEQSPPALPPRNNNPFRTMNVKKDQLDLNIAYIPSALLYKYQDSNQNHVHVFQQYQQFSKNTSMDQQNQNNDNNNNSMVDKGNQQQQLPPPPPPPPSTISLNPFFQTFQFICQRCHISLFINTTSYKKGSCSGDQYPTHHYHPVLHTNNSNSNNNNNTNSTITNTKNCDTYQCCGCESTVHISLEEPVLSLKIFDFLASTRPLIITDIPNQSKKPTMTSALTTLKIYIKNLLEDSRRNINTQNQHFVEKIGLDSASTQILEAAGFSLQDGFFLAPTTINKEKLQTIYEELSVKLLEIHSTINEGLENTLWDDSTAKDMILKDLLGCQYQVEQTTAYFKPELIPYCLNLGVTNLSSTSLIAWAFRRMIHEQPENKSELLKTLSHIASITNDDLLRTEVAIVISNGSINEMDLDDVHQQFGDINQMKVSDDASAEKSNSINQGNQIISTEPTPVGLNNIGNTCYLNSLLQYYFTLLPFRETIINMDDYVENEDKMDWQSKKIGGIEVDQQEVKRAKKFVKLLRDLFIQLQETNERAISPEYDLAYMALLNEKDNQENEKSDQLNDNDNDNNNRESTSSSKDGTSSELLGSVSTLVDSKRGSDEERNNDHEIVETVSIQENEQPPEYNEIASTDEMVLLGGHTNPPIDKKSNLNITNESSLNQPKNITPSTSATSSSTESLEKKSNTGENLQLPTSTITTPSSSSSPLPKKKKNADNMMFGKQQDVTECMGNVMYLVEAALKPEETENMEQTRDMIKNLFYGKARQILSYKDTETTDAVQKIKEEEFSHVIIDAAEGKTLYDGLDEYFFAEQVENFRGGKEVVREVSVQHFPPILQILIQRVQFDRNLGDVYKSNAFIHFDEIIYLDRYIDQNFELLAPRRAQVAEWNIKLKECQQVIKDFTSNKDYPMPVSDMLEATANILKEYMIDDENTEEYKMALELLNNEAKQIRHTLDVNNQQISELRSKIMHEYDDMKECAYRLHAVFIHQGQANYGHYWLYIYDSEQSAWWKFNDSTVSKVKSANIFNDTTGSTANPYFLVYVRDDIDNLVQTVPKPSMQNNSSTV